MNQKIALWQWVEPLSLTLVGGKAPVYWQRDLQLAYQRLDVVWQQSAWVVQIAPIALSLSNQPWLGYSLIALTQLANRSQEPELQTSLPRRQQLTWEDKQSSKVDLIAQAGDRRNSSVFSASLANNINDRAIAQFPPCDSSTTVKLTPHLSQTSSQPSVAMVLQQSPQVSRQLLLRLANETNDTSWQAHWEQVQCLRRATPTQSQNQMRATQPKISQQRTTLFNGSAVNAVTLKNLNDISDSSNRAKLPWTQLHSQSQTWQLGLVERTINSLSKNKFAGSNFNRLIKPESLAVALSLTQQWSTPLNGQTINLKTLKRLANLAVTENNIYSNATKQTEVSPATPINHSLDLPSPVKLSKTQHSQDIETAHNKVTSITPIAPPIVKFLLPPLLPPQMTNDMVPSVATTIIQQNAKQEETITTEEDLNVLATKIKRILDEEARRYGIDV